uniref:G-protein coupled receptors family 1 profile domain-containing protein n=1 Tax=Monodelphis domestica TaxID=13616 RepID=H9H705_MONDO
TMPGNGSELLDGGKAGLGPEPHVGALVAGVLLTAAVLAGNTLVCVSVAAERALQTPTNFFIVSLAVADLLLALLVLPLFVYSEFQGGTWALSTRLCDALMALDVMLCTASIFNLCAISVDRFIAVSVPLNYSRQQGGKRQLALIGATWGLAFAVASPVLFGLNDVPGRDPTVCQLESRSYVVASSVCSFFLPCPLMLVLYCAMKRAKITGRERKAMRVLPVVVGAFLLCWTPFFVVHVTRALCLACPVPPRLVSIVTWLGYVNSALNPVIYTVFNAEFRSFFRRRVLGLLC